MNRVGWPDSRDYATLVAEENAATTDMERRFDTDYARDRMARALYEIAVNAIGCGPRDIHSAGEFLRIRAAIALAIRETADVSLRDLAVRLEKALQTDDQGPGR